MRLRLIGMPLRSFRYAASRSKAHEAKGNPSVRGLVRKCLLSALARQGDEVGCPSFYPPATIL